jgi:hypothetical protein
MSQNHRGNCHCSACMSEFFAWLRKREATAEKAKTQASSS